MSIFRGTVHDSDGSKHYQFKNGATATTYPDGSYDVTLPSGFRQIIHADGTVNVQRVNAAKEVSPNPTIRGPYNGPPLRNYGGTGVEDNRLPFQINEDIFV